MTRLAMVVATAGILAAAVPATGVLASDPVTATGSTGFFVIGDGNTTALSQVEFWGAQWAKDNTLSGGTAPHSFKGWALNVTFTGPCSGTFTTAPGNSSDPPAVLPPVVEVLVASSVTQDGSVISGTFTDNASVAVDPGSEANYKPDPGHAGTGTVGTLCSSGGGPPG